MEDSGTGDSIAEDTAGQDTAGNDYSGQGRRRPQGLASYARPALIAGAVIAVVCIALLVIIFFLDSFNATVYSVGGKNVQDATDEARAIRDTYAAARLGGIIFLIAGILLAAAGAVLMYRHRNDEGQDRTKTTARTWTSTTSQASRRGPQRAGPRPDRPSGHAQPPGHQEMGMSSRAARTRGACPSLSPGREHDAQVSTGRRENWACPSGPARTRGACPHLRPSLSGQRA